MQRQTKGLYWGLICVVVGVLGLAVNLDYLQIGIEMVALAPLALGIYFWLNFRAGNPSALFPALLFVLISVPLFLTLGEYTYGKWYSLWLFAPGLAFLGSCWLGGDYVWLALPGGILTLLGFFLVAEGWLDQYFDIIIAVVLILVGIAIMWRHRRSAS